MARLTINGKSHVFDIDPATALAWGEALQAWGKSRPGSPS